jgi:predicted ester cyclase
VWIDPMSESMKEIIYRFYEELHNKGDLSKKDEIISPNYLVHEYDGDRNELVIDEIRQAFPDIRFDVMNMVIDGDMAATNWIATGTHKGIFKSIPVPPTNKTGSIKGAHFLRFANGKIEEVWLHNDRLGMAQFFGVVPTSH